MTSSRLVPVSLVLLSLVPVAAGGVRVTQLATGAEVTEANARFFEAPVPVVLHIIGATIFCVLGAFQFDAALRSRRPGWHRAAGRLIVPSGLIAALSGIWMTLFYPPVPNDGEILVGLRLLFGTAMAAAIVTGFAAIRRGEVVRHRAWMMRGYAIGMGAGTQAFTHLPWLLTGSTPDELGRAAANAAGWLINLAVAEWFIRRQGGSAQGTGRSGYRDGKRLQSVMRVAVPSRKP